MKTYKHILTFALSISFACIAITAFGQNTWVGGTIGAETDWNNPKNWSLNHVPDWTDEVVIIKNVNAQSAYYPVITNKVPNIPFLNIEGGAKVTIEKGGILAINGVSTHNYGILMTGQLYNNGQVIVQETALAPVSGNLNNLYNVGYLAIDDQSERGSSAQLLAIVNHRK